MSSVPISFITDLIDLLVILRRIFHKSGVFASNGWHRTFVCLLMLLQLVGFCQIRHVIPQKIDNT